MKTVRLTAAALALGMIASPALSQSSPQSLLVNFDGPQLTEALNAIEAQWQRQASEEGEPFFRITFSNGAIAFAVPTVCQGELPFSDCKGLRIFANFTKPETMSEAAVAQAANQFNIDFAAGKATYNNAGSSQLSIYIISDFGITAANLRTHLEVFQTIAASYSQRLFGAV